jgi:hypothetical protein
MTDRSVPIQLDKLRHLRFQFNDIADMQAVSPGIFDKDLTDFSAVRTYLWGGLRHEDKDLQPWPAGEKKIGEIVEALLDEEQVTVADIVRKCNEAMAVSTTMTSVRKSNAERKKTAEREKTEGEAGAPTKN